MSQKNKNYNVFADFHHASLLNSLIMLFEGRLGGNLYRPIGTEWHTFGYWKLFDHPATVEQFLGIGGATPDGTEPVNDVVDEDAGIYKCHDIDSGRTNKAITLNRFRLMPIDFVIASIPQHIEPFRRLCDEHPNHPKLIYQIGNAWNITDAQAALIDGIMASANIKLNRTVHGHNGQPLPVVTYHQEFDLRDFYFNPKENPFLKISSFMNCFATDQLFAFDWALFQRIEAAMSDWDFKSYGGQCRDGAAHGSRELSEFMRNSRFIWHTKAGGDGYGHIIHNAAAVGRPLIVRKSYYQGKMGEQLMIDGETCIAIDGLSEAEIVSKILHYSEPERWQKMCNAVYENFKQVVNFDSEAEQIKRFLQMLDIS